MRNRFLQGLIVLGLFFAVSFGFMTPAANAADTDGDGIDQFFETTGWWDQNDPNFVSGQNATRKHLYGSFPIACNTNAADRAFKVYYVTSADGAETSYMSSRPASVRNAIRVAASLIGASAERALPDLNAIKTSRNARFVTTGSGTVCAPEITEITVPESVIRDAGSSTSFTSPVITYIRNNLVPKTNTRYDIFMVQDSDLAKTRAYASKSSSYNFPYSNNYINYGGTIFQPINSLTALLNNYDHPFSNVGWILAHEMGHLLGALLPEMPGYNELNESGSHAADCNDVMCYGADTPGQTWDNGCGSGSASQPTNKGTYRLDCGDNDYFNVYNPTWETQRWNAHQHHAALWGNPQPDPNASPGVAPSQLGTMQSQGSTENRHFDISEHVGHDHEEHTAAELILEALFS